MDFGLTSYRYLSGTRPTWKEARGVLMELPVGMGSLKRLIDLRYFYEAVEQGKVEVTDAAGVARFLLPVDGPAYDAQTSWRLRTYVVLRPDCPLLSEAGVPETGEVT